VFAAAGGCDCCCARGGVFATIGAGVFRTADGGVFCTVRNCGLNCGLCTVRNCVFATALGCAFATAGGEVALAIAVNVWRTSATKGGGPETETMSPFGVLRTGKRGSAIPSAFNRTVS
jgi:hypothetical protein